MCTFHGTVPALYQHTCACLVAHPPPCLCRYLTVSSRARYLRDALQSYKSLFEDMDPFIEQLVARMRERGFRIPH